MCKARSFLFSRPTELCSNLLYLDFSLFARPSFRLTQNITTFATGIEGEGIFATAMMAMAESLNEHDLTTTFAHLYLHDEPRALTGPAAADAASRGGGSAAAPDPHRWETLRLSSSRSAVDQVRERIANLAPASVTRTYSSSSTKAWAPVSESVRSLIAAAAGAETIASRDVLWRPWL